jgi:hypothetical protein
MITMAFIRICVPAILIFKDPGARPFLPQERVAGLALRVPSAAPEAVMIFLFRQAFFSVAVHCSYQETLS